MRRRAHAGLGVYGVKLFDFDRPVGQYEVPDEEANIDPDLFPDQTQDEVFSPVQENYSNKSVAVFVLDIRSNKTPWKRGIEAFRPDLEGDFLGEHQWNWLETAIRRSKAAVNVVVSGVQVHPSIVSNGNVCEAWSHYPKAQQRLFDTLLSEGVQAPVIVSGDVHMSQMLQKDCLKTDGSGMRRPLFEMTTSGMTHSWGSLSSPPLSNPNQKSTFLEKYLNFLASSTMHVLQTFSPWTDLMISDSSPDSRSLDNRHVTSGLQYSLEQNFGELEFDWKNRVLIARTIGHGPDEGEILLSAKWNMDELSGTMEASEKYLTQNDFVVTETKEHATTEDGWVCINHRGQPGLARQLLGHTMTIASFAVLFPVPLFLPCALAFVLCRRNRRRASSAWKSKSAWFV